MSKRMVASLVFMAGLLLTVNSRAQSVEELMSQGKTAFEKDNITSSLDLFRKAYEKDSGRTDVNGWLGRVYIKLDNGVDGLRHIRKAYKKDPGMFDDRIIYLMGNAFQFRTQLDSAMYYYKEFRDVAGEKYQNAVNKKLDQCEYARELIKEPEDVKISNMGQQINSQYKDFAPAVNATNNMLIFTSNRKSAKNDNRGKKGRLYEDIFITRKKDGKWQKAHPVSDSINSKYHDASVSLSPDGKVLFFYRDEGLFKSTIGKDGKWSKPEKLPAPVNKKDSYENHAFLSPDGKKLYFTSDRKGGYGGSDIYVAEKAQDGSWEQVQNLGPTINTSGDEDGPFLDITGETLYFSSNGHRTMGGYDIFRSTYKEKEGGWSEPENLGYPVNSTKNDIFFTMSGDGEYAYFSSVKDEGMGKEDIYRLDLPADWVRKEVKREMRKFKEKKGLADEEEDKLRPVLVQISVEDKGSGKPLEGVQLNLRDKTGKNISKKGETNVEGVYTFKVKSDSAGKYLLSASRDGYVQKLARLDIPAAKTESQSQPKQIKLKASDVQEDSREKQSTSEDKPDPENTRIKTVKSESDSETETTKPTKTSGKASEPAEASEVGLLRNIYFASDKAVIQSKYHDELDRVIKKLENNSNIKVKIIGHTDSIDTDAYNKKLSLKRAKVVKEYLVKQGIDEARLIVEGKGEKDPMASNDDEETGRELNRRVEFKIIE